MTSSERCRECGATLDQGAAPTVCRKCGLTHHPDDGFAEPTEPKAAPRSLRSAGRRGRRVELADPAREEGRRRLRAAKWCTTAFWAGVGSAIATFLNGFVAAGAALTAVVAGVVGLIALAALGPGRIDGPDVSPIERVAAKMARRAKGEGGLGILIGAGILVYHALLIAGAVRL